MASIQKTAKGYRIQYFNRGARLSASFPTKRECQEWLAAQEQQRDTPPSKRVTVHMLLTEYSEKVTAKKKSADQEAKVIIALQKRFPDLMTKNIGEVTKADISEWRDIMLNEASPRTGRKNKTSTVLRYWTVFNNAFEIAIKDWGWLTANPMKGVTRPKDQRPRDRIITANERDKLLYVMGYKEDSPLKNIAQRVAAVFLFAWETGMRAGEIRNLTFADISGRVAKVTDAKTDAGVREVPLSLKALKIIDQARLGHKGGETIFELRSDQLDANFRKYREKAGLEGFTFHDTRATAITHLSKKLDILELAKAIGHKNLDMLMVYYREPAESIAAKLD